MVVFCYILVAELAQGSTHVVSIFTVRAVRNEPFIGLTPEPKLSVAVSVRAEAACLLKHGKV